MAKRISLTMSDALYQALRAQQNKNGYFTLNEFINETLRQSILGIKKSRVTVGKRTKKEPATFEDSFSRPTPQTRRLQKQGYL